MERSSNRRFGLSKEHRRWDSRGISNRISSAVCGRCNPSDDRPTNSATTVQERERRDPRQALPGARTAGYFFNAEADNWKRRRASHVLLRGVRLRHLLEKVGSSTLAVIPSFRGESGGCRSVVENNAVGTWEQGQNQESDERLVFSCDPMGVDRTKPDQERTSECEAHENARCPDTRRDYGTAQRTARTSSNGGRTGRFHRFATWRTDRLAMGGCGLREPRNPCSPFSGDDGPGCSQDGSFRKGCTARRCFGRVSVRAEAGWSVQSRNRLGVCLADNERQTTRWPETVWRRYGRPAVKAANIQKRVGFHTFRRTYTTLLTQNNEDVKVVQDLLGHANSRITLDLYAQAGMPNKRLAQSKLVRMVLNKGRSTGLTGPNWTMTQIANSLASA